MAQRITSLENKDMIFEAVADKDVRTILESTRDFYKSANQIILECNLAQSTAYRKLKRLARLNIINVKYVMGEYSGMEMRYRSNLCLFIGKTLFSKQNI